MQSVLSQYLCFPTKSGMAKVTFHPVYQAHDCILCPYHAEWVFKIIKLYIRVIRKCDTTPLYVGMPRNEM